MNTLKNIPNFAKLDKSLANEMTKLVNSGQINPLEITVVKNSNSSLSVYVNGTDWNGRMFYSSWYDQQANPQN
jgi:hypothetical protein